MLDTNLFESILIEPAIAGADRLLIVSGYATAAMGLRHIRELQARKQSARISLIVGMCPQDGLAESNHKAFQQLAEQFPAAFECSYVTRPPAVHSKVYCWCKGTEPFRAFVGSANYSQGGFRGGQHEAMEPSDPQRCAAYYKAIEKGAMYCTHPEVEDSIQVFSDLEFARRRAANMEDQKAKSLESYASLPSVIVDLLDNKGELPKISGLNWGQREGREPNQAYIRLPLSVARTDFFPARAVQFTVLTDDGKVLICTRAQDQGKAIETPQNNSLIGEYFRNRLGVANGRLIAKEDLQRFGRTTVRFYKIDDETYFMDFSPTRYPVR